jgi:hypothetical protein
MHRLLGRDDCPQELLQGAARRLLFDREGGELLAGLPDPLLARLARWGWRHPREDNRRETSLALAGIGRRRADELLLETLREPPAPRPLPPDRRDEPGGQVCYQPRPFDLPDELSERALAAWLLAHRKFRPALAEIERLAGEGPAGERASYRGAGELLSGK